MNKSFELSKDTHLQEIDFSLQALKNGVRSGRMCIVASNRILGKTKMSELAGVSRATWYRSIEDLSFDNLTVKQFIDLLQKLKEIKDKAHY